MWRHGLQAPCKAQKKKGDHIMSKYQRYYQRRKAALRCEAIEWGFLCADGAVLFWSDIAEKCEYFAHFGRRFGLLREFRENAVL